MNNTPCNDKECPMMNLRMAYCYSSAETDPPCIDMTKAELQELRNEIDEKNHDKGE